MPYLTLTRMRGDADALLAVKRERFDMVAFGVGTENGMIFHLCARTEDGLLVLNLWESQEGSEATSRDPRLRGAKVDIGAGDIPIEYEHYEVEQFDLAG